MASQPANWYTYGTEHAKCHDSQTTQPVGRCSEAGDGGDAVIVIPEEFNTFIMEVFGEEGSVWLAALPALIDEYAARWSLVDIGRPFALSYNYVIPVVRGRRHRGCAQGELATR